jgi:hypothetical protein
MRRNTNETRSTRSRGDRRDNTGTRLRPCNCSFQLEIGPLSENGGDCLGYAPATTGLETKRSAS